MTIMTQLLASQFRSPSPPTSSWRWRNASETPSRTRLNRPKSGKIRAPLNRKTSMPHLKSSDAGARARNRDSLALTAAFKSP